MIFVILGSQKFQFNRILEEIDRLIACNKIKSEDVFAQIGYSTYIPKYYNYKQFLDKKEFESTIEESEIIITHGGTGSIINSIKKYKKVIAIPRLSKYGEHVDDHQLEIIDQFSDLNYILGLKEVDCLEKALSVVNEKKFKEFNSNTSNFLNLLEEYLK